MKFTSGRHAGDSPPGPFEGEEPSDAAALSPARIFRSLVPIIQRLRWLGKVDAVTRANVVRDALDEERDLMRGGE